MTKEIKTIQNNEEMWSYLTEQQEQLAERGRRQGGASCCTVNVE